MMTLSNLASLRRASLLALLSLLLGAGTAASAQARADGPVPLRELLDAVAQRNLDLQAQQEGVAGAQAGVTIAGLRPDPQFTGGIASKELSQANKPNASTATTAGLALTLETGGKRAARVRAAEANVRLAEANVGVFHRQLEVDAAAAFVEACRTDAALARQELGLEAMQALVKANEVRFKAGDIGRLELAQSRLEAERFKTDVAKARADRTAARIGLDAFLGQTYAEAFQARPLQCDWALDAEPVLADELVTSALERRDDVRAAEAGVDSAREALELARANRWVDPVLNVGLTNTPRVNAIHDASGNVSNTPAERSLALNLTLTVPIPLSRRQQGDLRQAEAVLSQAQLQLRSVQLKAEGEVRALLVQDGAAGSNLRSYQGHVLVEAEQVLEGIRTSYRKGAASLVELLTAQRSADEVYLAYLQARSDQANARIRLQISTGAQAEL